jgi:hypothetical protein
MGRSRRFVSWHHAQPPSVCCQQPLCRPSLQIHLAPSPFHWSWSYTYLSWPLSLARSASQSSCSWRGTSRPCEHPVCGGIFRFMVSWQIQRRAVAVSHTDGRKSRMARAPVLQKGDVHADCAHQMGLVRAQSHFRRPLGKRPFGVHRN